MVNTTVTEILYLSSKIFANFYPDVDQGFMGSSGVLVRLILGACIVPYHLYMFVRVFSGKIR